MSVDASIPLQIRPMALESSAQNAAQTAAWAGQMMQNLQAGMQLKEQRRQQEEVRTIRDVFARHVTQGPEGPVLDRAGVLADVFKINPDTAQRLQQGWTATDLATSKATHEARKAAIEAQNAQADFMAQRGGAILALHAKGDTVGAQRLYAQTLQDAPSIGLDPRGFSAEYDPGLVTGYYQAGVKAKERFEADQKANEWSAPIAGVDPKTGKEVFVQQKGKGQTFAPVEGLKPRPQQSAVSLNLGALESQGQDPDLMARRIVQGLDPYPSARQLSDKSGFWIRVLRRAQQIDPTFNASIHKQRADAYQKFTTGKHGDTINAIGTTMQHIRELSDIFERVPDMGGPFLNTPANWLRKGAGDARITEAETAAEAVANEAERVYRGAGGSEHGIEQFRQLLNPSLSKAQRRANLAKVVELLGGKMREMESQYRRSVGDMGAPIEVLTPEAQEAVSLVGKRAGHAPDKLVKGNAAMLPYRGQSATQADLEHTAKVHGKTVDQVKADWIRGGGRVVR